jgi:hypothetical protein
VAELEISRRRDVHTLDAHAWALSGNGKHTEARLQVEKALAVGIKDPEILFHAGVIASRLGDRALASKYYRECLGASPSPEMAAAARKGLGSAGNRQP